MSNIKFMCIADAIRSARGNFESTIEMAVLEATSSMSAEDLRMAFFHYGDDNAQHVATPLLKAA